MWHRKWLISLKKDELHPFLNIVCNCCFARPGKLPITSINAWKKELFDPLIGHPFWIKPMVYQIKMDFELDCLSIFDDFFFETDVACNEFQSSLCNNEQSLSERRRCAISLSTWPCSTTLQTILIRKWYGWKVVCVFIPSLMKWSLLHRVRISTVILVRWWIWTWRISLLCCRWCSNSDCLGH